MIMRDAVLQVAETRDARMAGRIAEQLRLRGMTYAGVAAFVAKIAPELTADVWEDLMQEADQLEGERADG